MKSKDMRRKFAMYSCLVFAMLLVLLPLSGCGFISDSTGDAAITSTPVPMPLVLPHRDYRAYAVGLDASYNKTFFEEAKQAIANWVDAAVVPNIEGFDVYVILITSNSFPSASTVLTIHCPAIPAESLPPGLTPTPTLGANVYDKSAQATVDANNSDNLNNYYTKLNGLQTDLTHIRSYVHSQTAKLRSFEPNTNGSSGRDIYGMIKRASYLFENVGGEKYLYLASNMVNTEVANFDENSPLYGATVKLLWWDCNQVATCADNVGYWYTYFKANGSTSEPHRYSPSQSVHLPNPFA